jgi:two-component system chemotaxis response regulator CheY
MFAVSLSELYVCLVEPSRSQARVIVSQMQALGVNHVEVFDSGEGALAAMLQDQPDLVVSAMHLPDITGTELVQRMRADEALRGVAFMLVSSETGYRYLEPIRQAGAVAMLPKPFAVDDLKRALSATLDLVNPTELAASDLDLDSLRVLVVDDSTTARHFIRHVLESLGLRNFEEAANGREAAARIEEQMFDLVVTDYNMPEMDGKELIEYIRNRSSQASVPIMMVTSEANQGRLSAVQQAGVSAVCDKPFEPATVRQMLEQILNADQW